MSQSPRILIVRTDRMGDVILSTPVIRTLRAAYPNAYLGMMVQPANRELVEGNPDLDVVLLYDKQGSEKSWLGTLRFARKLKTHRFDTTLILHSTNRVIWISWLAGIRRRVGYARRLPWLFTHRLPYIKREGTLHELDYNLRLLELIGVRPGERTLHVPLQPESEQSVLSFLESRPIKPEVGWVAIHPGASCASKRWPAERFAETADALVERFGVKIVLFAGPGEKNRAELVAQKMKYAAQAVLGQFSLGELAWLLKKSRCLISNDSGPVHLSVAVGTPVVSIFGRWGGGLSPERWGPTGENSLRLHKDIGCRPCLAHRCPIGFACLQAISVEEVLAAAEHLMVLEPST